MAASGLLSAWWIYIQHSTEMVIGSNHGDKARDVKGQGLVQYFLLNAAKEISWQATQISLAVIAAAVQIT